MLNVLSGRAPAVQFIVNRTQYNMRYYLADDIYQEFATFVKTISMPQGEKRKLFAQRQESARKDVERAFGVLQSRFAIICGLTCFWDGGKMKNIIHACIILYNMIVEHEHFMKKGHVFNTNIKGFNKFKTSNKKHSGESNC